MAYSSATVILKVSYLVEPRVWHQSVLWVDN
jgi:hypothetical protein